MKKIINILISYKLLMLCQL